MEELSDTAMFDVLKKEIQAERVTRFSLVPIPSETPSGLFNSRAKEDDVIRLEGVTPIFLR